MSEGLEQPAALYTNALDILWDYGDFDAIGRGDLRLTTGFPFEFSTIPGEGSAEGRVVAAIVGRLDELRTQPDGPLVRLNSACLMSEVGDNEQFDIWHREIAHLDPSGAHAFDRVPDDLCECREQRIESQRLIAHQGGIYFDLADQDGRGWGQATKRRTTGLQRADGIDTVTASERLGIEFDVRRYDHVAKFIAENLRLTHLRLMSNNRLKIAALEAADIIVTRVPLVVGVTPKNIKSLRAKRDLNVDGHLLPPDSELDNLMGT